MKITGNEPAQPTFEAVETEDSLFGTTQLEHTGLTIRQHFAAMAMQGLITGKEVINREATAKVAVECADALIAELNKAHD